MSSSSRIRKTNHASGFDRRRPGHGMKRLYGMDSPAVVNFLRSSLKFPSIRVPFREIAAGQCSVHLLDARGPFSEHPYIPGRLGITSRYARDYDSATVVRPQKFGFFNQALPSISAGHVNEVRAYV
uniref:Uncharacterized protein n=1 Tax=Parascaris univalens TaxID=6257 RepID=A0A915CJK3_PARUN